MPTSAVRAEFLSGARYTTTLRKIRLGAPPQSPAAGSTDDRQQQQR
jgi:hypothetical protein